MTSTTKGYRLRVATAAAADVANNVDFEVTANIANAPVVGGQTIRVLGGRTETRPWIVEILDDAGSFTAQLADAGGRAVLLRRLCDISETTDGGATYTVLATGRIAEISLNANQAIYRVSVHDERLIERQVTIFTKAGTTRAWLPGLVSDYRGFASPPIVIGFLVPAPIDLYFFPFSVTRSARNANVTTVTASATPLLLAQVRGVIEDDVKPGMGVRTPASVDKGSFFDLRINIGGTDFEVVAFRKSGSSFAIEDEPLKDLTTIFEIHVYDPTNVVPTAETAAYLYFPEKEPTPELPLHIGGSTGIHPFQLLKDIYDGSFQDTTDDDGNAITVQTVRYDANRLGTYDPATNPDGLIDNPKYPKIFLRILQPANMARWLEENIYRPFGVVPFINAAGEVAPKNILLPASDQVPDINALFEFNAGNSSLVPTWEHTAQDQVTVLRFTHGIELLRRFDPNLTDTALDRIELKNRTLTRRHDQVANFGEHVLEMGTPIRPADQGLPFGIPTPGSLDETLQAIMWVGIFSRELFQRFGDGPVRSSLKGLASTSSVEPGDFVIVNFASYPNLATGARGGKRLMQVLSRSIAPDGFDFELLDAGPDSQPLAAPTLAAVAGSDTKHEIDITISNLPASADYLIHAAKNATEPAEGSSLWQPLAEGTQNETITFSNAASNTTYWFRARATKEGRISSSWSNRVSVATTAMTAASGLTVSGIMSTTADLSWTNGEAGERIEVLLNGILQTVAQPLVAGTTKFRLTGLTPSTTYNTPGAEVRHVDSYGGLSATVSASFTTTATPPTLNPPEAIAIVVGEDPTVRVAT
ncbi:MAG: hypothetical protein ACE5JM_07205 [Armatimonadota bacterium]